MKKLRYSRDYYEKLQALRKYLDIRFGDSVRKEVLAKINKQVHSLRQHERSGISVRDMFGIDCEYYYIYIAKNIIFYRFDDEYIYIINMYNEREDYIQKMFGSSYRLQEQASTFT